VRAPTRVGALHGRPSGLRAAGLARVRPGGSNATSHTQQLAQQAWGQRTPLRDLLAADPHAERLDLDAIFDYGAFTRYAPELVGRLEEIA
jgi:Adenylosuccinate lyase C-terminus